MVFHKTREQGEGVEQTGPLLLFRVHIHTIYTGFTHFCREISLVAITRFGRHFLAKIGGRRHKNIFEDRAFKVLLLPSPTPNPIAVRIILRCLTSKSMVRSLVKKIEDLTS